MGRLFLVEFDNFDSGKFFVCDSCGTPLARNTDVFLYGKRLGEFLEEIIFYSLVRKISNVRDSDVVQKAGDIHKYDRQQSHCVACNRVVGIKYTDTRKPSVFHAILSSRVRFRMSGDEQDPSSFPPDEWFDPPRPVCESM